MEISLTIRGFGKSSCVTLPVTETVAALRAAATAALTVDLAAHEGLRLVSGGRILRDDTQQLSETNLSNGKVVIAMKAAAAKSAAPKPASPSPQPVASASPSPEEVRNSEIARIEAHAMRAATVSDAHAGEMHLELLNQDGIPLSLPPEEFQALKVGMLLYAKGRRFASNASRSIASDSGSATTDDAMDGSEAASSPVAEDESTQLRTALLCMLRAEQSFGLVSPRFLGLIDNYPQLNLDICWLYYRLRDFNSLPTMQRCLRQARLGFATSHGENLERLKAMKGSDAAERVLYVRLHFLEGLLALLQGRRHDALLMLTNANGECDALRITEEHMVAVMSLGFSRREAVRGLRLAVGRPDRVEAAVDHLLKLREEMRVKREEESVRRQRQARQRQLGRTQNGAWVHMEVLETLGGMGFPELLVVEALKQTNNDQEQTFVLLATERDRLEAAIVGRQEALAGRTRQDVLGSAEQANTTDEKVAQLQKLMPHVEEAWARRALMAATGSIAQAHALLVSGEDAMQEAESALQEAIVDTGMDVDTADKEDTDGADAVKGEGECPAEAAGAEYSAETEAADAAIAQRLQAEEEARAAREREYEEARERQRQETEALMEFADLDRDDEDSDGSCTLDLAEERHGIQFCLSACDYDGTTPLHIPRMYAE